LLAFNSHIDTVPPAAGWTMKPWEPTVIDGRVFGLGSNDAKASVAAMTAAFLRLRAGGGPRGCRVALTLVVQEETGGDGAEILVPELARQGLGPDAAVIGEPTGLDVAVAQKGLLMLELRTKGQACHAAHGRALGAKNAVRELARDLVALEGVDLGPDDPELGPLTMEPTLAAGGTARNVVPAEASCALDVRINPGPDPDELLGRLRAAVGGEVVVRSDRLKPCRTDPSHPLVPAALAARPGAVAFGSRGLSDWVYFRDCPSIKVGPGRTERSHTPDEFVLESEILEGAAFYEALVREWAVRVGAAVSSKEA
jgi:acetylornithine deacetylase